MRIRADLGDSTPGCGNDDYPMRAHPADDPDLQVEDYPMRTHAICQKFLLLCLLGKAKQGVQWLADTFNKIYYRPGCFSGCGVGIRAWHSGYYIYLS
jgi:hypothetical protein